MSKTIAAIILGMFILMAAVVIADPSQSDKMLEMAMGAIKWLCIGFIVVLVVGFAFLAYIGSRW